MKKQYVKAVVVGLALCLSLNSVSLFAAGDGFRVPMTFGDGSQQRGDSLYVWEETALNYGDVNFANLIHAIKTETPNSQEAQTDWFGIDTVMALYGYWGADLEHAYDGNNNIIAGEYWFGFGREKYWPELNFNFVCPTGNVQWVVAEDPQGHQIVVQINNYTAGQTVYCDWVGVNYTVYWPDTIDKLVTDYGLWDEEGDYYPPSPNEFFGSFTLWGYTGNNCPVDMTRPQGTLSVRVDPFNVINGNVQRDETDILLPALGLPLVFGRSYNSVVTNAASFGVGWRASIDWSLGMGTNVYWDNVLNLAVTTTVLQVETGEGRTFTFNSSGSNWICNADVRWKVTPQANGEWVLDGRNGGGTMRFDTNGLWSSMNDGWGNMITLNRDPSGLVTNIAHSSGLSLNVVLS
jgi:hypothetical protein